MLPHRKIIIQSSIFQGWHWFTIGLIIPVLALFQLERGLSLIQIGINMALYSGTVIILEIPSGILADFLGQKKVYLLSLLVNSITMMIFMLTNEMVWNSTAFVFMGAGRAFSSGSLEAIFINNISAVGSERDMERLFSTTQFSVLVGLAFGALLGGYLPDLHVRTIGWIPLSDFYSLSFFTAVVLNILLAISVISFIKSELIEGNSDRSTKYGVKFKKGKDAPGVILLALNSIKKNQVLSIIMLTTLAWGFAFSGLETFWQPRVYQISGGTESTFIYGLLTNGYFLAGALGSLISWPLCRFLGNKPFVFLFFQRFILGIVLLGLSSASGLGWFSIIYISLFLFNGMSDPVEQSILNREIPSKSRATLLSVVSFFLQAGGLSGVLIWGYLSELKGIGFSWKIGAVILIVSSFTYLLVIRKNKKEVGANNEL